MTLIENFNTSDEKLPYFLKHENFVIDLKSPGCAIVESLNYEDRCDYVRNTSDCHEEMQIIDYTNLLYCIVDARSQYEHFWGSCLLAVLTIVIFQCVGTVTEKFFCPTLKIIAKMSGMSQNLAGVTLLAFGNGVPDLMSTVVAMTGNVDTLYSKLTGSAIFTTAFIAGLVIVNRPMVVEPLVFARDLAFHIFAIAYIDYAIRTDRAITLPEAIIIFSVYIVYFFVVMLDHAILIWTLKDFTKQLKRKDRTTEEELAKLAKLKEEAGIEIIVRPRRTVFILSPRREFVRGKNQYLVHQLIDSLNPIEHDEWDNGGFLTRLCVIFKIPMNLILYALVPTVNYDLPHFGWSKLLNCIQIMGTPFALSYFFLHSIEGYQQVPYWSFVVTVPIAVGTFLVSTTEYAPRYHLTFALFTICSSILLIRVFTREMLNVIEVLGIVTCRSQSFLGCTIETWGNCIGDLWAALQFASQGYQKMGLAACIAGPLFYISTGMGFTFIYRAYISEKGEFAAKQGSMGENCTVFMMANLVLLLFASATTGFIIRKSIGYFQIFLYGLFLIFAILGELQIIHPFGTDHGEDYGIAFL